VNSERVKTHCFGVTILALHHESIEINYKILYIYDINVRYLFYFFYIAEPCTRTNGAPGICMPKDLCVIIIRSLGPIPPSSCGSSVLNCCPKTTDRELSTCPIRNKNGLVAEGVLKTKTYGDELDYKYYLPYLKKKECTCE